eukprot:170134-Rhodomonas_salina.2
MEPKTLGNRDLPGETLAPGHETSVQWCQLLGRSDTPQNSDGASNLGTAAHTKLSGPHRTRAS